jgi:hypothetical protein
LETDETKQFAICQNGREMRTTPELFPAPIGKLLGFTIVRDEEGKAAIEFEATESHANPMGTLHGGCCAIWRTRQWAWLIEARWRQARVSRRSN